MSIYFNKVQFVYGIHKKISQFSLQQIRICMCILQDKYLDIFSSISVFSPYIHLMGENISKLCIQYLLCIILTVLSDL